MNYIVLLFGTLIALGGAVLLVRPDTISRLIAKHADSMGLHLSAIIARVILGVVLIIAAPESRFPVTLQVLGWLSIAAALVLGVIGRARLQSLIQWALGLTPRFKRPAGILAVFFGGFLVYAVL